MVSKLILLPGPTHVHPRVLRAMLKQMMDHRAGEFYQLHSDILRLLLPIFKSDKGSQVFLITGSGTAAVEALISNLGTGRKILAISNGFFGERLIDICARHAHTIELRFKWGYPMQLEEIESHISQFQPDLVALVHNETSTGMLNPLPEIARIAKRYQCLVAVDGVSAVGGETLEMESWGVDGVATASQKCLGGPPGLGIVCLSSTALENLTKPNCYYLDLGIYREYQSKLETPFTPCLPVFYAFREALLLLEKEGLDKRIKRHALLAEALREAFNAAGLKLFPRTNGYSRYSNTVTAVNSPIDPVQLRARLAQRGLIIAGGQGELRGKIFRVATMGYLTPNKLLHSLEIILRTLIDLGLSLDPSRSLDAASSILTQIDQSTFSRVWS